MKNVKHEDLLKEVIITSERVIGNRHYYGEVGILQEHIAPDRYVIKMHNEVVGGVGITFDKQEFELRNPVAKERMETLADGAIQTHIGEAFHLLSPQWLKHVAIVRGEGATKYGIKNHIGIPVDSSLNHAITHLLNAIQAMHGESDADPAEEIAHASCRMFMAYDNLINNRQRITK